MENKKNFYIDGKWVTPKSKEEIKVIDPATEENCAADSLITLISNVPTAFQITTKATTKPKSPNLVIKKAFLAARTAWGFSNQKPIKRNEQSPINSQKIKTCNKFTARTAPSILKIKIDKKT